MEIKLTPDQEPLRVVNDIDNIYFATARRDDGKFYYVYTLVSPLARGRAYELIPHTVVCAFDTRTKADGYYGAVNQIMAWQSKTPMYQKFLPYVGDYIAAFNSKMR